MSNQDAPPHLHAYWPANRRADQAFVVLGDATADRLVPVLAESARTDAVPASISDIDFSPEALTDDLRALGVTDTWMLLPDTERSLDFYKGVSRLLVGAGEVPAVAAFLPGGLELDRLLDRLPPGAEEAPASPLDLISTRPKKRSRCDAFYEVVQALWLASGPPDEWVVPYIEGLAGPGMATSSE